MGHVAHMDLGTLRSLFATQSQLLTDLGFRLDRDDFEHAMKLLGVIWVYPGEPRAEVPHALLTSEKHSNGYLKPGEVLKQLPGMTFLLAREAVRLAGHSPSPVGFDWVVGSDTSATPLAAAIAELAEVPHVRLVKQGDTQVWTPEQDPIPAGSVGLHVEELITTLKSAREARKAVTEGNPGVKFGWFPYLPVLVDRSDPKDNLTEVDGSGLVSFVRYPIVNFDVPGGEECRYCSAGSLPLKPMEHQELFFGNPGAR